MKGLIPIVRKQAPFGLGRVKRLMMVAGVAAFYGCMPPASTQLSAVQSQSSPIPASLKAKLDDLRSRPGRRYDQPQEAAQYYSDQRRPVDGLPLAYQRYISAQAAIKEMPTYNTTTNQMGFDATRVGLANWTDRGPSNVAGRTRVLRFRPGTPTTMYAAGVAGGVWRSINSGVTWVPLGDLLPNIGVTSMVIDPTTPDTMYVGTGEGYFNVDATRGGGIFKSVDGGLNWAPLVNTLNSTNFRSVNDLIQSSENSAVLYATTNSGLWRSLDSGVNWTLQINASTARGCFDLEIKTAVDADADDLVWVSCGTFAPTAAVSGIWRSVSANTGAPATYTQELAPTLAGTAQAQVDMGRISLALAPNNQSTIYALVARSNDGAAPTSTNLNNGLLGVYRSTDSGANWTARLTANAAVTTATVTNNDLLLTNPVFTRLVTCGLGSAASEGFNNQGWYDQSFVVDPFNDQRVWVGGIDLWRSDDGGANFGVASYWWINKASSQYNHADQHGLIFDPGYNSVSNKTLWAINDGGVFRTNDANLAVGTNTTATSANSLCFNSPSVRSNVVWTKTDAGYNVTQFYDGDVFGDGSRVVSGAQDNGTNLSPIAGTSFTEINGGDGGYVAVDPVAPSVGQTRIYAETTGLSVLRSDNTGTSFVSLNNATLASDCGAFISPFTLDKSNPVAGVTTRLYTGGTRLMRLSNANVATSGTAVWTAATAALTTCSGGTGERLNTIAIAPGLPDLVVFGTNLGRICRLTNATTASNTALLCITIASSPVISSVVFVPNEIGAVANTRTAYATVSSFGAANKVLVSIDGGQTWSGLNGTAPGAIPDIPVHTIAVDTNYTNGTGANRATGRRLYIGTDLGVFVSIDSGTTWARENTAFANTPVEDLQIRQTAATGTAGADELYAFTHGRGIFSTTMRGAGESCNAVSSAIPDNNAAGVDSNLIYSANGVSSILDLDVRVAITHARPGDLELSLTNVGSGVTVPLMLRPGVPATANGCAVANLAVIFNDDADYPAEDSCAAASPGISGQFRVASGSLTQFNAAAPSTTWRLNVADRAAGISGTLTNWCITPTAGNRDATVPVEFALVKSTQSGISVETTANAGTVAFDVLDADGSSRVLARIASRGDSFKPERYDHSLSVPGSFYLNAHESDGRRSLYGPYLRGESYGSSAEQDSVATPWAQFSNELATHNLRSQRLRNTQNSAPEIMVVVNQSGIQRLRFEDFQSAGALAFNNVPVSELALTLNGISVALNVVSDDSVFNAGDLVEFYGRAVARPGDDVAKNTSLYSSENFYQLSRNPQLALRMVEYGVRAAPVGVAVTETNQRMVRERNRHYNLSSPISDPWADSRVVATTGAATENVPFSYVGTTDAAKTITVEIYGGVDQNGPAPDHHVEILLNGVLLGEARFDGFTAQTLEYSLAAGALHEGENVLGLRLLGDTGYSADVVYLEQLSIEGSRGLVAENGALIFELVGASAGVLPKAQSTSADRFLAADFETAVLSDCVNCRDVMLSGLDPATTVVFRGRTDTAGVESWEVLKLGVGSANLRFTLPVSNTERWYAADSRAIKQPSLRAMTPTASVSTRADYVVITHPLFAELLEPLLNSKRAQGLSVHVVSTEQLYAQYSQGRPDASAIQRYLISAQQSGTRFALLVGSDTIDARAEANTGSVSFVPTAYVPTGPYVRFAPSDAALAPAGMAIGRFPARSMSEVAQMVAKAVRFDATANNGKALFSADIAEEGNVYSNISEQLSRELTAGWQIQLQSLDINTADQMRAQILASSNSGVRLLHWFGHSAPTRWSFANVLNSSAILTANLSNASPNAVIQWGCWASYFVDPSRESMANTWLAGTGGAAIVLGTSTLTETSHDQALAARVLHELSKPGATFGEALARARVDLAQTRPEFVDVILGTQLLGDPAAKF